MTPSQCGRAATAAATLFLLCIFTTARAYAENFWAGDISVSNLSAAPTSGFSDIGHVALTIANLGDGMDSLASVEVPPSLAAAAGVTRMAQTVTRGGGAIAMTQPIFLKPRTTVTLGVSDVHLVLFGLKRPLRAGETFPVRLHFQQAGMVEALVRIENVQPGSLDTSADASDDEPPSYARSFSCTNGEVLKAEFTSRDNLPVAIVGDGADRRVLAMQPWHGLEARLIFSDGAGTLEWTSGMHLMWMDGATHLMCGGGHHSH